MDVFSFLGNSEAEAVEELYKKYRQNPQSIDNSWQAFFKGFEFARIYQGNINSESSTIIDKEFKVINLIDGYRKRGHLFTRTNPVRSRRKYSPTLAIENYGLGEDDRDTEFQAGKEIGIGPATLKEIVGFLEETYCGSIGVEFMFIRSPEKTEWLMQRFEKTRNRTGFSADEKRKIFGLLCQAGGFEQFVHKRFTGQKRFSLEGAETLIPALHYIMEYGSELGISEFVIGMAHRGRLNVLANILRKPHENIFKEFNAEAYEDSIELGDVKYHLGYSSSYTLDNGKTIALNLAPNPSHLEAVSPVIQGISRARIDKHYNKDSGKLVPVLIHGDAAIAGQGVVYEVVQMMNLPGYTTGGTIHIVINNQVGFTTNYLDARSSTYCTDVGKVTKCPIFHVNGDDAEAIVHTVKIAMEYRQTFHSDVFIDILSYRRYGHNEGDEPRYTQPTLYKAIATHPGSRDIYAKQLIKEGVYSDEDVRQIINDYEKFLEGKFEVSRTLKKVRIQQFLHEEWKGFTYSVKDSFYRHYPNGITRDQLKHIGRKICHLPENETFIKKTYKLIKERSEMIEKNKLDWAMCELLAYGTLVYEGYPVRISGQDSVRGTFAHRHATHVIESTDKTYTPLKYIDSKQADFSIYNSPLNEYGVLGFEYGYALATPMGLTIWEAQYGDFHNVAQVIIDQYIASAEEKWGLMNGIVLYLPHGFEGQGPEHSSARIERFLSLAARENMMIVNPTTPANLYHVLRQQMLKNYRVPLIIFTPKSLLRHPECTSTLEDLSEGHFNPVIDDSETDTNDVKRLVFCSGKFYYDLLERKRKLNARDIAIVRVEQLHPFPFQQISSIVKKYKNSLVTLWAQEEPINMGGWRHIAHKFKEIEIYPIARLSSGSPATGLAKIHQLQQEEIIDKIFRKCVCDLNLKYCGLQCKDGILRQEILKQYRYFTEEIES